MASYLQANVTPLYNQILVGDEGTTNLPEWETGDEDFVQTSQCLYVRTRPDYLGDVTVLVSAYSDPRPGKELFDGIVDFKSGVLEIGNIPAAQLHRLDLESRGPHRLAISIDETSLSEVFVGMELPGTAWA